MTLEFLGALCVAVAIVGGGLKINEVEVPRLSPRRMAALVFAGLVFLGVGLLVDQAPSRPDSATSQLTASAR